MTAQEARHVARVVVKLRQLLINVTVCHASGDRQGELASLHAMDLQSSILPLPLRSRRELERRVGEPVRRKINREGILAQNVRGVN